MEAEKSVLIACFFMAIYHSGATGDPGLKSIQVWESVWKEDRGAVTGVQMLLLVPFFLMGGFGFDSYGKQEHHNPEGNADTFPERAVPMAGPAAQGMKLGRTHESATVGGRGSTRGCHRPPGGNPPLFPRKSLFHGIAKKNTLEVIFCGWLRTESPVGLDHSSLCVGAAENSPWQWL